MRKKIILTAKQAKAIDLLARDKFGISTLVLMENAGSQVAKEAAKLYRNGAKVALFCGKGNNGGDGFVAARHLLSRGIKPDVFLASRIEEVENEAGINLDILLKLGQKVKSLAEKNINSIQIDKYDLIIDALLGVGLSGHVRGIYKSLINKINSSRTKIISVDVPSGLDATTGKILGVCVKADSTVTFIAVKKGMLIGAGPEYCGKIIVAGIGLA